MDEHTLVMPPGSRFRWDAERGVLVYDGTNDPDPHWKWNPDKLGYEPVEHDGEIFDRRMGVWVHSPRNIM